jgi:two-component system KDP operon response regulator KdpE
MNLRVLVIDDEIQIRRLVRMILQKAGWEVFDVAEGKLGLNEAVRHRPDIVILDLELPDIPGLEVLRRLRKWTDVPILVLSVSERDEKKIAAFESGADDYVTKPFAEGVLLARLRALSRHRREREKKSPVAVGGLVIDLVEHKVLKNGKTVELTDTEFALLSLLAVNLGRVLTQGQILRLVWGPNSLAHAQYLRVYINRLRQKLEDHPSSPALIKTEAGIGYRLEDPAT